MLPKITVALAFVLVMLFAPLAPYLRSSRLEVRRRRVRDLEDAEDVAAVHRARAEAGPYRTSSRPTDDVAGPAVHVPPSGVPITE